MSRQSFLRLIPAFLSFGIGIIAADSSPWHRISEGKIVLYTRMESERAFDLLNSFAQLSNALAQASPFHGEPDAPLKIIAFQSSNEFNPYRLNAGSTAFYENTGRAEYLVLQDMASDHREVALHEFTHFVVAHSGEPLPLWLNEGIADFYSSFRLSGHDVIFGAPVQGRLHLLHANAWLPLRALFGINTSASFSDVQAMYLFYSESWLLTHMLLVNPAYSPRFDYFLRALREGHSSVDGLALTYNKTPEQVEEDLRQYGAHRLPEQQIAITPLPAAFSTPSVKDVSDTDIDVALADLSLTNPNSSAEVASRLNKAASRPGADVGVEEALGLSAFRQNKFDEARVHLRRAVEQRSNDPLVYLYLAHLDRESRVPAAQVLPLLAQAIALKPDLADAQLEYALVATEEGNYAGALAALNKLSGLGPHALRPENAFAAAYARAYCDAYSDNFDAARKEAEQAKLLAANDNDRSEIAELLTYIGQQMKNSPSNE